MNMFVLKQLHQAHEVQKSQQSPGKANSHYAHSSKWQKLKEDRMKSFLQDLRYRQSNLNALARRNSELNFEYSSLLTGS